MAVTSILEIFILVLGLNKIIAKSEYNNTCVYGLANKKDALDNPSLDLVALSYTLSGNQSGCITDVNEIFKNLTKYETVNKTNLYLSITFLYFDYDVIHFLSAGSNVKFYELYIFIDLSITMCTNWQILNNMDTFSR
jgi:hypothetical protein